MWVSTSSPAAFPLLASEFPSQNNESDFSFLSTAAGRVVRTGIIMVVTVEHSDLKLPAQCDAGCDIRELGDLLKTQSKGAISIIMSIDC